VTLKLVVSLNRLTIVELVARAERYRLRLPVARRVKQAPMQAAQASEVREVKPVREVREVRLEMTKVAVAEWCPMKNVEMLPRLSC
jgi:hypothetical protein